MGIVAWILGALNSRKYASCSWCALEIRTDAISSPHLAELSLLIVFLSLPSLLSLFLSSEHNNNANVSSETESKEEFGCSCTDGNRAELKCKMFQNFVPLTAVT